MLYKEHQETEVFSTLDRRLVAAVKGIKLLASVSWPAIHQRRFLRRWQSGRVKLPKIHYAAFDYREAREELIRISASVDTQHPVGNYLHQTAGSWITTTRLLENLGTSQVTDLSIELFGRPGDLLPGSEVNNVDAATHFMAIGEELGEGQLNDASTPLFTAEQMQALLQPKIQAFFHHHDIKVVVDSRLVSKAAAGAKRIRLRSTSRFSEYDIHQLLEHEAYVHSLTALNGRAQPHLASLGCNSPRITATQEGLATFAELITGQIDIERMKRISMRILAIDMALKGADFIDVFKFFLEGGQTETDSFSSAMRVFRGVPLTGGSAFTKDTVYLHGLLSVHTFFRLALKHGKFHLCRNLFSGKMTLNDAMALDSFFKNGYIVQPLYLPRWLSRTRGVAGLLAFSLFANRIRLDRAEEEFLSLSSNKHSDPVPAFLADPPDPIRHENNQ